MGIDHHYRAASINKDIASFRQQSKPSFCMARCERVLDLFSTNLRPNDRHPFHLTQRPGTSLLRETGRGGGRGSRLVLVQSGRSTALRRPRTTSINYTHLC